MRIFSFIVICTILAGNLAMAQEVWVAPEEASAKLSTRAFTEADVAAGEKIYQANCLSCHGAPGQANGLPLVPAPVDPASDKMQANTDGSIYYKIAEGRVAMPSFKNLLSSADIWSLVAYFRSFNDSYVQQLAEQVIEEGLEGASIKILLAYLQEKKLIEVKVQADNETSDPVAGAEVKLYAKRMFGNLPIDEARRTNSEGIVLFNSPEDLPSDNDGNMELMATLVNEDLYGVVQQEQTMNIGIANTNGSLLEHRAMWNRGNKAPLWIQFAYFGAVLVVWGFIMYIMLQLRSIFLIGGKEKTELDN